MSARRVWRSYAMGMSTGRVTDTMRIEFDHNVRSTLSSCCAPSAPPAFLHARWRCSCSHMYRTVYPLLLKSAISAMVFDILARARDFVSSGLGKYYQRDGSEDRASHRCGLDY